MRYIFLAFCLLGFLRANSQSGNYFLSHFSPTQERFDNVCFDIAQHNNGLLYFATRNGILEFDGRNWTMIAGVGAVYALQITTDGNIYWAGALGYGKVEQDDQGLQQIKISSAAGIKDVFQTLVVGSEIYFLADDKLLQTGVDLETLNTLNASNFTGSFTGIVEIFGSIYLNTQRGGVFKVENNKLVQASLGFSSLDEIVFAIRHNDKYLIGLSSNKVYTLEQGLAPSEIVLEDQQYADASVIVTGRWVNQDLIVLGTLRGGMIYADISGKTREIINYSTGLPDNEVYALMSDRSQSIWAAHEYGFTRVSPYLPFRSYSHYAGLQGNLLCAISTDDGVYVGTSLGLFKLTREEVYEEISYYVEVAKSQKTVRQNKQSPLVDTSKEDADPTQELDSRRRGLLHFLRRNKDKRVSQGVIVPNDDDPLDTVAVNGQDISNSSVQVTRPVYELVKKTDTIFRSAQYVYQKVKGIDAKVTSLVVSNGKLIAAGLGGTYEVQGVLATSIQDEPARFVFPSRNQELLFVSTYKNEIRTFLRGATDWISIDLLSNLDDQINFIFQGDSADFWFCGVDKLYRLKISDYAVENVQTIPFPNPNFDPNVGMFWRHEVTVANSLGFFRFSEARNSFLRLDSLGEPSHYYAGDSSIWYRDSHRWNLLGKKVGKNNLQLLNLYGDLRFISADPDTESLWLITGSNELYRFNDEKFTPQEVGYPLILKSIRNSNQKVSRKGTLQFNQEKSSVTFEVVQPDYMAPQAIEYRYQLMGLEKSWSEWSISFNIIDFPYLPPGDYALQVQSKDIFGNVKDLPPLVFEVLAPYWKRPWFYALEFILFAGLVLLSLRLSTRYRVVSRLLSLLTIILLIQFIQTVTTEVFETRASPVMDFFVQVLVALLILPFEGYLRNLLLGSVDSKSILHRFISPSRNLPASEKEKGK